MSESSVAVSGVSAGPMTALDVITDITGSEKVNLLGVCLGGTLTMATLAYLNATGADRERDGSPPAERAHGEIRRPRGHRQEH